MAQTNFTPISLYYSTTASAAPTAGNLVAGELAINTADGKLFYKDSSGVVQVIAGKGGAGVAGGSTTQVQYNSSGSLAGSSSFVFDGTNVGIGTSSPTEKLDVLGSTDTTIRIRSTSDTALILNETTPNKSWKIKSSDGTLVYQYSSTAYNSGYSSKMAITSAGQLVLGGTTASGVATRVLDIVDGTGTGGNASLNIFAGANLQGYLYGDGTRGEFRVLAGGTNYLSMYTNSTERMRITSGGTVLIGNSSAVASEKTLVYQTADSKGLLVKCTNASYSADGIQAEMDRNSTSGAFKAFSYYNSGAGAYKFYVIDSGAIYSTSIVITSISDEKLKENIKDIDTGLDSIMALKPRRFDWKEGKGQDKKNVAGFIAQEFETVFPECVSSAKDGADGIEYKNINHETLIPTLVKAMQEQQALINNLTTRLNALEGK
jgi:hypothetical protein